MTLVAAELGSTGALEMLVFQRLLAGKGTKPFRLPSCPRVIPLQGFPWAEAVAARNSRLDRSRSGLKDFTCMAILRS